MLCVGVFLLVTQLHPRMPIFAASSLTRAFSQYFCKNSTWVHSLLHWIAPSQNTADIWMSALHCAISPLTGTPGTDPSSPPITLLAELLLSSLPDEGHWLMPANAAAYGVQALCCFCCPRWRCDFWFCIESSWIQKWVLCMAPHHNGSLPRAALRSTKCPGACCV